MPTARNVLHRDIKPGNIMLGRFGETLVVDWGLTKILGDREEQDESSEGPLQSQASEAVEPTRMDSAIGTPRYMSPEQAAGKGALVGPASDIFGLGATLYCILTGRPPFTGADRDEVKERACRGIFIPPRKLRRDVPAPLESICIKAMEIRTRAGATLKRAGTRRRCRSVAGRRAGLAAQVFRRHQGRPLSLRRHRLPGRRRRRPADHPRDRGPGVNNSGDPRREGQGREDRTTRRFEEKKKEAESFGSPATPSTRCSPASANDA